MECQKCKKVLAKKGSHFVCQGPCQGTFHRGCVKGLAADLKNGRDRIYCNNCEEDDSEEETEEADLTDLNHSKILKDIQKKVGAIPGLLKQLDNISQTLNLLSDKYDTLVTEHEQSKQKIFKLEKTVVTVRNKCVFLEKCNAALEQKVNDIEQSSRNNNLEIVGVEQVPGENLKEIVSKVGAALSVSTNDIEWVRRARQPRADRKPAPILVGFKASGGAGTRDAWLTQRRKVENITSNTVTNGSAVNKLYINEDLTHAARTLLWNAKKHLRGIYKYIWVSNGRVLVKKTDGDKTIRICVESDITDLNK